MARMNVYFDCRHSQDFWFLQSKRRDMLLGIKKWQNRANRVIRSSLAIKRTIAMAELKTVHETERGDLEANYRNRYAELEVARATDNGTVSETAKKRREITLASRADRRAMGSRQKQEVSSLQNNFSQCSVAVTNETSQLMNRDTGNIHQQFLDKSARLKREYEDLKDGPTSMSPNDYAASRSSVPLPTRSRRDEDPIGIVQATEGPGSVTVTSQSGETVEAVAGTPIYQGDIVETGTDSRCTIVFTDETEFAIAEDSRVEINEWIFDPNFEDGEGKHSFKSFLRGVFMFTSGLIPRKEPRDVDIPVSHLGRRG